MSIATTGQSEFESGRHVLDSKWDGRDTFTVTEVSKILRLSRWAAYAGVKKGDIPAVWIGRRCIVPRRALERLLSGTPRTA
jgi:excisionase family DNA binding protein